MKKSQKPKKYQKRNPEISLPLARRENTKSKAATKSTAPFFFPFFEEAYTMTTNPQCKSRFPDSQTG